jgi:hypothetical protein
MPPSIILPPLISPTIVSSPLFPSNVSAPPRPVNISSPLLPAIVSTPELPVKVKFVATPNVPFIYSESSPFLVIPEASKIGELSTFIFKVFVPVPSITVVNPALNCSSVIVFVCVALSANCSTSVFVIVALEKS